MKNIEPKLLLAEIINGYFKLSQYINLFRNTKIFFFPKEQDLFKLKDFVTIKARRPDGNIYTVR